MRERAAKVEDWSWGRTRRRVATLGRFALHYKVRTSLSVISLLAATATALAPPFLSKYAVDDGIRRHDLAKLWWIVGAFLLAGLLNWGMSYVQTYLTGWVGERILADLRNDLFRHLQRLSLGFYERNRAGVLISRLTNDVEAIDQLVTDGVTSLVQNTLTLVGTAILLFILDWRLALATLAVIPLMSIATVIFRVRSARAYSAVRERLGLVTATLAEDIAGMRVVQAFTREQANTANFREVAEAYRESNMQTVVLNGLYFPFVDLLSTIALGIVLLYGGHLYFHGLVTVGTLFAFMLYVQNFFDPVQQLSQLYNTFLSATAALDKIMDVLEQQPEVRDRRGARVLPQFEELKRRFGAFFNLIYVRSDDAGRVIAHFTLYNMIGWQIVLADGNGTPGKKVVLISNALDPVAWSDRIADDVDVPCEWLNTPDYSDSMTRTHGRIVAAAQHHHDETARREIERITDEVFKKHGIMGENDPVTDPIIQRKITDEITRKLAAFAARVPHAELMSPEELAALLKKGEGS